MIRKLALFAGAAFIAKKWLDRTVHEDPMPDQSSAGHVPSDLLGDRHPDGSVRADDHFRPDPTAPISTADRESMRPVTYPAPHDPPGR